MDLTCPTILPENAISAVGAGVRNFFFDSLSSVSSLREVSCFRQSAISVVMVISHRINIDFVLMRYS